MSADMFGDLDLGAFGPEGERLFIIFMIVYLCVLIFVMLYGLVMYVLQSVGLHTIAKRRGIHHPWLAWIPIAANWLIGSISDQYQFVAKGRVRNRRKVLLGLSIPTFVLSVVSMVLSISTMTASVMDGGAETLLPITILMLVVSMIMSTLTIVLTVFQCIALYDLYTSCTPKNAVLFLILQLLFGLGSIFIFAVRNKDEGMPPRRIQVPVAPWTPAPPPAAPQWQQNPVQQNVWQPPVAEVPAEVAPVGEAPVAEESDFEPEQTNE